MSVKLVKRKLWADKSMVNAVKSVQEGKGLREASRLYSVLMETLMRRVTGVVEIVCRPGPHNILTESEEQRLAVYIVDKAEMGFGLTKEDVLRLAIKLLTIQEDNILLWMVWLEEHGLKASDHAIQT